MSQLENLLERVRLKGQHTRTPGSRVNRTNAAENMFAAFSRIPWDDVLMICIDHKLKDWQIPGPPVCEGANFLVEGHL